MSKLLIPITEKHFKEKVKIRFNNILDGLDNFFSFTLEPKDMSSDENEIINYILKVFDINNSSCYIDFYINRLSQEEKENLISLVPEEDKDILIENMNLKAPSNYFKVENKELIPFLTRLSTRENFFVTFYFTETPITIWGNYGMKFPCFCLNEQDLYFYSNTVK